MTARRCDAQKFHSAVFDAMLRCYILVYPKNLVAFDF